MSRPTGPTGRFVMALAIALLAVILAPASGALPATPARAAATDLTLVTDAVYAVQPDRGRARVTVTIVARNHLGETRTKKYYFDHAFLAVPPNTNRFRVSGAKGARVRVTKRSAKSTMLRIDFGPRLYGGASRTYRLTFDLVDKGGKADRQLRIGTSLITLPIWAFASDGARGSTVRVRFPAGYDVTVESGSLPTTTPMADGGTELSSGSISSPQTFFAYVTGQRAAVYLDSPLAVSAGNQTIALTMRAWIDDTTWAKRTGKVLTQALPALREAIGLDWPLTGPTVVQEAVNREAGGYAGRFDPAANRIEVAYWADPLVAIHQAAHAWFNGRLLADRWANEGFAAYYARRVANGIGIKGTDAGTVAPPSDGAAAADTVVFPLNAWAATPEAGAGGNADPAAGSATEVYGFAASLALATAIADRAGDDVLRRVWSDVARGVGAYRPPTTAATETQNGAPPVPETVSGVPDWRGFLDVLEAETGRDFSDLWRQWVVRPDEAALLDARAAARLDYERTLAIAGDWQLPREIREALRAWQFQDAEQRMVDARTVLAQRSAVEQLAARSAVKLPASMQQLFESGMLAQASAEAEAERNAMLAVAQADAARESADDVLTRIGMLGEHPDADLALARNDLAAGNIDGTLTAADDAYRAWNGAWQEGRRRMLLAIALVATLLVLASAVATRARRARRSRALDPVQAHRVRP